MKKSTKIIIATIVLILVIVAFYVIIFEEVEAPQAILPNQSIPADWIAYRDDNSGVTLKAPRGLILATSSTGLSLIFSTTTPYVNTHLLHELRIDIATPAVDCVSTGESMVGTSTKVVINGLDFEKQNWSGVGLGNLYQGVDYTIIRNSMCYQVSLFTHSTNGEGFYTNDATQIAKVDAQQKLDIDALFKLFDQVAGTIKFVK